MCVGGRTSLEQSGYGCEKPSGRCKRSIMSAKGSLYDCRTDEVYQRPPSAAAYNGSNIFLEEGDVVIEFWSRRKACVSGTFCVM